MRDPVRPVVFVLLLATAAALASLSAQSEPAWKLVWADEFNTAFNTEGRPNPANWIFENGFVRNEELQWYQPQNAYCRGGYLILEARREKRPNPDYQAGASDWKRSREFAPYTSASLQTKGLHAWRYGRFEMRARIDTSAGLWPAFWTLGVTGEWPSNGEIDIMEYYRNMVLANVAWATATRYHAHWSSVRKPLERFGDPAWSAKFHVWRMDWDAESIQLFVDGELMNHVELSATTNGDGSGINPFKQPQFVLLDLAVGGKNGGDPSATKFPAQFEVDYVRVYQKQ